MAPSRPRVALFVTCLVDLHRPSIGFAAIRLLEQAGCQVEVPRAQTCCGQPAYNSGDRTTARRIAWQSMLMVLGWSVLFAVIGIAGAGFVMRDLVGAKGQVAELGTLYLRVILGGSFSIFFLLQVTAIQRALGSLRDGVRLATRTVPQAGTVVCYDLPSARQLAAGTRAPGRTACQVAARWPTGSRGQPDPGLSRRRRRY